MMPFYFGPAERTVFGAFHPALGRARHEGVVICHPFGNEYLRAYQACRRLAMSLSEAGLPTLRFDYYGTGDSAGEHHEGTPTQWRQDIETAVTELRDMAGVSHVSLVGVRLGAALAATLGSMSGSILHLVLWDPVVHGKTYVDRLTAAHTIALQHTHPRVRRRISHNGTREVIGAVLSPPLLNELEDLDLCALTGIPARRVSLIVSEHRPEYAMLHQRFKDLPIDLHYGTVPTVAEWDNPLARGTAVLAPQMIDYITALLTDR